MDIFNPVLNFFNTLVDFSSQLWDFLNGSVMGVPVWTCIAVLGVGGILLRMIFKLVL